MHAADEAHDPGERVELLGLASVLHGACRLRTNTARRTAATKTKIKPQPGQKNDADEATRPQLGIVCPRVWLLGGRAKCRI
jgi:hypothetical protein